MKNSVLVSESKSKLSGTGLKIFACIAMLIAHTVSSGVWIQTMSLLPLQWEHVIMLNWLGSVLQRTIGRMAFPIFGFLLVEGARKTGNMRKYVDWLGITAIIFEMPFDLALFGSLGDTTHQNVMVTLLLGLMALYCLQEVDAKDIENWKHSGATAGIVIIFTLLGWFLRCDYGGAGVLYICTLYLLRKARAEIRLGVAATILVVTYGTYELGAYLACPLLLFYNGQRGKCDTEWKKLLFYAFYPAHLILLYIITRGMLPAITKIAHGG